MKFDQGNLEDEVAYSEFEPTTTQALEDELNLTSEPEEN